MQKFTMPVSKTVNSKRVAVGIVEVTTPLLADVLAVIATAEVKEIDKEDGLPVYSTEEANWVFSAVVAKVMATARNKMQAGSTALKEGLSIPTTWAEFVAEGTRGGGAALANMRDCKAAFAAYINTLGKSEATTNQLILWFSNKPLLASQASVSKGKFLSYVEQFAETLNEADADRFLRTLEGVTETATSETVTTGDDF